MTSRLTYSMVLLGSIAWCAIIVLAPLSSSQSPNLAHVIYGFFNPICHQDDARSFHIGGEKLAVCIRCVSIYCGFLVGICVWPFLRKKIAHPSRVAWIIAVAPMILDVAFDVVGIHSSTTAARLATGAFFGVIAAQLILPAALEAFADLRTSFSTHEGTFHEPEAG